MSDVLHSWGHYILSPASQQTETSCRKSRGSCNGVTLSSSRPCLGLFYVTTASHQHPSLLMCHSHMARDKSLSPRISKACLMQTLPQPVTSKAGTRTSLGTRWKALGKVFNSSMCRSVTERDVDPPTHSAVGRKGM